jgi:hypothetical protein
MVTSTTPKRMAVLYPTQELFNFSPFGLGCRQCEINIPIQMEARCIRDHLKNMARVAVLLLFVRFLTCLKPKLTLQRHQGLLNHTDRTTTHTQGIHAFVVNIFIPGKEVQFGIARRQVVMLPNSRTSR